VGRRQRQRKVTSFVFFFLFVLFFVLIEKQKQKQRGKLTVGASIYHGTFEDGMFIAGDYTSPDGTVSSATQFVSFNLIDGKGTVRYADKSVFHGTFKVCFVFFEITLLFRLFTYILTARHQRRRRKTRVRS
jgi:preprotein translocase subunit YajC